MSASNWIVVAIVVVVVIVILVAVAAALRARRRREAAESAARAAELRQQAHGHVFDITSSRQQVIHAEAEAAVARERAMEADRHAREARESLAHDEAAHEDLIREADRLDPQVDHTSDDYRPDPVAPVGGAHAGAPVDRAPVDGASSVTDPGARSDMTGEAQSTGSGREGGRHLGSSLDDAAVAGQDRDLPPANAARS